MIISVKLAHCFVDDQKRCCNIFTNPLYVTRGKMLRNLRIIISSARIWKVFFPRPKAHVAYFPCCGQPECGHAGALWATSCSSIDRLGGSPTPNHKESFWLGSHARTRVSRYAGCTEGPRTAPTQMRRRMLLLCHGKHWLRRQLWNQRSNHVVIVERCVSWSAVLGPPTPSIYEAR